MKVFDLLNIFIDISQNWLNDTVLALLNPGSRLFVLNMVGSLLIILAWSLLGKRQRRGHRLSFLHFKQIFHRRYWWNRSTRLDYKIYFLNALLKIILIVPLLECTFAISRGTLRLMHHLELDIWTIEPRFSYIFAYSLFAYVLDDFLRFLHHMLMHRIPLLWEFHKFHHSARVLTPLTLYRLHPVESMLATIRNSISLGLTTGIFVSFFDSSLNLVTLLGVNAFGFTFNFLGSNLRHSHIPVSFGWLECVFISPKQHQIHHSRDAIHFNKNYGTGLALWDRCFGSYLTSSQQKIRSFGITETMRASLWSHLWQPFQQALRRWPMTELSAVLLVKKTSQRK